MRAGVLFAGIGGDALGLEVAGFELAWFAETDPFACRVLAARYPDVPNLGDVAAIRWDLLPWEPGHHVDLVAGGFPCQDISNAHTNGERRALEGAKSGLWTHFRACLAYMGPRWALIENVAAFDRWVPAVRADLAHLGYASLPVELPAGTFGAPHVRPRIFVVAHADGQGEPLRALDAQVARLRPVSVRGGYWRSPPPGGFRVDDGVPGGVERSRALGNAVAPQAVEWIGRRIMEAEPCSA